MQRAIQTQQFTKQPKRELATSPLKNDAFYRFTFIQKYQQNQEESEYPEIKELETILTKEQPEALLEELFRKCLINVNVS